MSGRHLLAERAKAVHWIHLLAVYGLWLGVPSKASGGWVLFAAALVGGCQNIGLLHEHFHHWPKGPGWLVRPLVHLGYLLGGLNYPRGRMAHLLHHAYLGTDQDPDRAGYLWPTSSLRRFVYLFCIGPLRRWVVPVDIEVPGLSRLPEGSRTERLRQFRRYDWAILGAQAAWATLLGPAYLPWFAGLLAANVFSNAREMAEHRLSGDGTRLLNLPLTPWTLFLGSGPGFWFHGTHHRDPALSCWELPFAAIQPRQIPAP